MLFADISLGLFLHGLFATNQLAVTRSRDNQLGATFSTAVSFPHLVSHIYHLSITIVKGIIILLCRVVNAGNSTSWLYSSIFALTSTIFLLNNTLPNLLHCTSYSSRFR